MMRKHIPNAITLCNLLCGSAGIISVLRGDVMWGAYAIWGCAMFDFLDGWSARLLKAHSPIGKDLDSLADLISFCLLPASVFFVLLERASECTLCPYGALSLPVFGALRLAKFNNDPRQSDVFYGLPVPAVAIFTSAFPFAASGSAGDFWEVAAANEYVLLGCVAGLSWAMLADVRLMSFKVKDWSFKNNVSRYIVLFTSIVFLLLFKIAAFPLIIIFYVTVSILTGKRHTQNG